MNEWASLVPAIVAISLLPPSLYFIYRRVAALKTPAARLYREASILLFIVWIGVLWVVVPWAMPRENRPSWWENASGLLFLLGCYFSFWLEKKAEALEKKSSTIEGDRP